MRSHHGLLILVILFVGATLALVNWSRAAERRQAHRTAEDQVVAELTRDLENLPTRVALESQIKTRLTEFATRIQAMASEGGASGIPSATGTTASGTAAADRAWREILGEALPPHDVFVYGRSSPGSGPAPLLYAHEHPLGLGRVAGEVSAFLDSFTEIDVSGRPRSHLSDAAVASLARRVRAAVGVAFPFEPTLRTKSEFLDLRSLDRRPYLIHQREGDEGKVIMLLDGTRLTALFSLRLMARSWREPGSVVGFWDAHRRKFIVSAAGPGEPGLIAAMIRLARREGGGFRPLRRHGRWVLQAGTPLPGGRFRPVLARYLGAASGRNAEDAIVLAGSLLVFFGTIWTAVEGLWFGRRRGFSVRAVLVFAFVGVSILPLAGVGSFAQAIAREWAVGERDRLARELHQELRSIDQGFPLSVGRYLHDLRAWAREPAFQARLEKAWRAKDQEATIGLFEEVVERFRPHEVVKYAALVGPEGCFASWRVIFQKLTRRGLESVMERALHGVLAYRLGDLNPALRNAPEGASGGSPGIDRLALYREMGFQALLQVAGPLGFITLVNRPENLGRIDVRAHWLGLITVPVPLRGVVTFLMRWHLSNRELEHRYLQAAIGDRAADDPAHLLAGVSGMRDHRLAPVPPTFESPGNARLMANANLVYDTQVGMRYQEGSAGGRRLVEIMSPRHLRFILIGTRGTAWLDAAIRRVHDQTITVLAAFLAIAILIGGLTAAFFLEPLRDLRRAVKAIQRGDLAYRLDLHRGDEFDDLAGAFNAMAQGLQEGRILRRFVSGSVRRMVGGQSFDDQGPARASSRRSQVTILYSQVRVSLAGRGTPDRFFACLESHVRAIEEAVGRFGGDIDKIIGEKVLVVFPHEAFADGRAAAEAAFQVARRAAEGLAFQPDAEAVAGGVATGEVVAGVLGAASVRLDHTVIGDPVNLAARLAALAAHQEGRAEVLAAGDTVRLAGREGRCRLLDLVTVKGKTRQVEAWRALD